MMIVWSVNGQGRLDFVLRFENTRGVQFRISKTTPVLPKVQRDKCLGPMYRHRTGEK